MAIETRCPSILAPYVDSPTPRTLLTLPAEIRHMIFQRYFRSIVVSQGLGSTSSNHTSLLSTCRQIHQEARPLLVRNISFHFKNTAAMLDVLTTFSPQQIQEIRHMRVRAFPFLFYPLGNHSYYHTHDFSDVLPLFPGP